MGSEMCIRDRIVDAIHEIKEELEERVDQIETEELSMAEDETIMTLGHSTSVANYLSRCAETTKFNLLVAENDPAKTGKILASKLLKNGVST